MVQATAFAQNPPAFPRDPLTGLYQQDFMLWSLTARRRQGSSAQPAILALLQLENFYEIRGWVGKAEADLLFNTIAASLHTLLPDSALLCRCQRYEFAVLLPELTRARAQHLIERIKQALRSASSPAIPPQLELRCAVGLADFDGDISCAEACFARARHSLSRTLARRGESEPAVEEENGVAGKTPTPSQLLALLQQRQLQPTFQPVVSLAGDSTPFFEIRTACHDPRIGTAALIEQIVQNALGERLDRWIVSSALHELRKVRSSPLHLLINLTQNSLVSRPFLEWLASRVAELGARAASLVFQISELDLLSAQHHVQRYSEILTAQGCQLSISYFGCTPDPCRYLSLLQAHYVKLDSSLTIAVERDSEDLEHLLALTARLQALGLRSIAGQVDAMALLPRLWSAGINYVQGNCLAAPSQQLAYNFPRRMTLSPAPPDPR